MSFSKLRTALIATTLFTAGPALMAGCATAVEPVAAPAVSYSLPAPDAIGWDYGLPPYAQTVTNGGNGGEIVRVTSLESEGPGTLRAALEAEHDGPVTIVFEVAGAIDLDGNNLPIRGSDITIAGQTAPSPGITLIRGGFTISGHDIIVQHLRVRPGDRGMPERSGDDIDGLSTGGAYNIVVDHCSFSWATDENLSSSSRRFSGETPEEWHQNASHDVLYSNNIIAEGLAHSVHAKGEHSKGSLIHDHVNNIVLYANLYSSNYERSPLFKGDVHGAIVNNFIYNPGQRAVHYNLQALEWAGHAPELGEMDLVSNVMRYGPSTQPDLPMVMIGGIGDLSIYESDNIAVDRWGHDAPMYGHYTVGPAEFLTADSAHMDLESLRILPSEQVETYVLTNAGARPWDRDTHDVRVTADAAEGRGGIIDSQDEVGGYPEFPEVRRAFNPENWDLNTMSPRNEAALSGDLSARGT